MKIRYVLHRDRKGFVTLVRKEIRPMYVSPNFKTKAALKRAVQQGKTVTVFSPGPFPCPQNGRVTIEGPHYPEPHRWYANVIVTDGKVTRVAS